MAPQPVGDVSVSLTGPTDVAGGVTTFAVMFTTSSTGGLTQAAGSYLTFTFPTGTDDGCNTVYDVTTQSTVVAGGCNGNPSFSEGMVGNTVVAPGDTLLADFTQVTTPPRPGMYTVSVSTSSDIVTATSANTFTLVPAGSYAPVTPSRDPTLLGWAAQPGRCSGTPRLT